MTSIVLQAREHVKPRDITTVYYHAGCSDGFAARWVAERYLGEAATYHSFYYFNPPDLEMLRDKTILFVDCSLKPKDLLRLQNQFNATTLVLDHHKTAKDAFRHIPAPGVFIDTTHCASILAWHYFYGLNHPLPRFLRCIEDRDLWRWTGPNALPESRKFTTAFQTLVPFEFKAYEACMKEERFKRLVEQGELILEYQTRRVETVIRHASLRQLSGKTVAMLNCTETNLISDVGVKLMERDDVDFALLWYYNGGTKCIHVSLRSDGRTDVEQIAKQKHLGGGGHRCAAAFVWYDRNIESFFDMEEGVGPQPNAEETNTV